MNSCLTLRNELPKETQGQPKQKTSLRRGKGTQENQSAMWFAASGFMVIRCVSRFFLASHLVWLICCLIQDSSWWCLHLSAKMDSRFRVSGRLERHPFSSLLLSAPPEFSLLIFCSSITFLIDTCYCEVTHASSYHCAWPRQVVLVNGSLTL